MGSSPTAWAVSSRTGAHLAFAVPVVPVAVFALLSLQVPEMNAQGRVALREHQITFSVPKGIRAGQHIRLAGQGAPGSG